MAQEVATREAGVEGDGRRLDGGDQGTPMHIHTQAFWLYTTIVGLSIKEALSDTVPFLIAPPPNTAFDRIDVACRLSTFLIVTIRFYLGSALFFELAHTGAEAKEFPDRKYIIDFLAGTLHFLLFFAWAFSIDIYTKPPVLFPVLMGTILLYDLAWLFAVRNISTMRLIKVWTLFNAVTFVVCFLFYVVAAWLYLQLSGGSDYQAAFALAEKFAFAVLIFVSLIELWSLMSRKEVFKDLIASLVNDGRTSSRKTN